MSVRYGLRKFKGIGLVSCVIGLSLLGYMGYSTVVNADDTVSSAGTTVESTVESTEGSVDSGLISVDTDNSDRSEVSEESTENLVDKNEQSSDSSNLNNDKTDNNLVNNSNVEENIVEPELKPLMLYSTSNPVTNSELISSNGEFTSNTDTNNQDTNRFTILSYESNTSIDRVYNEKDKSYQVDFKGDWVDTGKLFNDKVYFDLDMGGNIAVDAYIKDGELFLGENNDATLPSNDITTIINIKDTNNINDSSLNSIFWNGESKVLYTGKLPDALPFTDIRGQNIPYLLNLYRASDVKVVVNMRNGESTDGTLFTKLDLYYLHGVSFSNDYRNTDIINAIGKSLLIPSYQLGIDKSYMGDLTCYIYSKYTVIMQNTNILNKEYYILENSTAYRTGSMRDNIFYRDGKLSYRDLRELSQLFPQDAHGGKYSFGNSVTVRSNESSISFISNLSNGFTNSTFKTYNGVVVDYKDGMYQLSTNSYIFDKLNRLRVSDNYILNDYRNYPYGFSNSLDVPEEGINLANIDYFYNDFINTENFGIVTPSYMFNHGLRLVTNKENLREKYIARIDFCTENGTVGHQDFIDTDYDRVITVSDLKIPDGYRLLLRDKGNSTYPNEIETIGRISRSGGLCVLLERIPEEPEYPSEPSNPTEPSEPTKPEEEPNNPTEEPNTSTEEPNVPNEEPEVPSEEPTKPDEEPAKPEEEPTKPSEETDITNEEPSNPEKEPSKPSEESDKPNKEPNEPTEEPDEPTDLPNKPNEEKDVPKEDTEFPNETSKEPNVDSNIPNEKINLPNTGKDVPIEKVVVKNPAKSVEIIDKSSNKHELPKTNYESNKSLTVLGGLIVYALGVLGLGKVASKLRKHQN